MNVNLALSILCIHADARGVARWLVEHHGLADNIVRRYLSETDNPGGLIITRGFDTLQAPFRDALRARAHDPTAKIDAKLEEGLVIAGFLDEIHKTVKPLVARAVA